LRCQLPSAISPRLNSIACLCRTVHAARCYGFPALLRRTGLPSPPSFDHLGGAGDERRRNFQAEYIRGLEVDDKLEFGRLLDRQVAGLFAFEDAIVAPTPAIDELDIAAFGPAQGLKCLPENHDPSPSFRVISNSHQHAHPPHAIGLLRAGCPRPRRRGAQKDHEFWALHVEQGPSSGRPVWRCVKFWLPHAKACHTTVRRSSKCGCHLSKARAGPEAATPCAGFPARRQGRSTLK